MLLLFSIKIKIGHCERRTYILRLKDENPRLKAVLTELHDIT